MWDYTNFGVWLDERELETYANTLLLSLLN